MDDKEILLFLIRGEAKADAIIQLLRAIVGLLMGLALVGMALFYLLLRLFS